MPRHDVGLARNVQPVRPLSTRISREQEVYDKARVDKSSGELLDFDEVIYPAVVRQRQYDLIRRVATPLGPERVLDVGCGGGWSTRFLSRLTSHAVGLDASRALVATAHHGDLSNTDFIVGDGNRLPLRERSIDLIVSIAALHHLETKQALYEWRRVLKPEGQLLLFEPNRLNPLAAIGRRFFRFETHTPDERPFARAELKSLFTRNNWELLYLSTDIQFTFAISRLARVYNLSQASARKLVPLLVASENVARRLPLSRGLGWILVVLARPRKT